MDIKRKLAKLIDVKSIMTLLLTLVFCIMALCGVITGQEFLTIFTVIVGFYFGSQSSKKSAIEAAPAQTEALMQLPAEEEMQPDTHPPDIVVKGFGGEG